MRAFYGQRCGTAVDLGAEFPGYTHAACHIKGEFHSSQGKQVERDNIGGWRDAGVYGRYVVNYGITTLTPAWMWKVYGPKVKNIKLNVAESGNGTTFSLSWMTQVGMNPYRTRATGRAERTRMPSRDRDCCPAVRMPGGKMMR
jgi:hypothetical protein